MTPTYLFNKSSMELIQQPDRKKPICIKGISSNLCSSILGKDCECEVYKKYFDSLRRIPTLVEWEEGKELVEGRNFELFECDLCEGVGWYEGGKTLQTGCGKCNGNGVIAVPTKAPVPAEGEEKVLMTLDIMKNYKGGLDFFEAFTDNEITHIQNVMIQFLIHRQKLADHSREEDARYWKERCEAAELLLDSVTKQDVYYKPDMLVKWLELKSKQ